MFKKIILVLIFICLSSKSVFAQDSFSSNAFIEYKILQTGLAAVTHTITITNNSSNEYVQSYLLELSNLKPENIQAYEGSVSIPIQLNKDGDKYFVKLNFLNPVVGKGKSRTFIITYTESGIASHNGEVWELIIPRIQSLKGDYKLILSVPSSFGQEALISPESFEKKETQDRIIYTFSGDAHKKSGISAIFGKFQAYSLKLDYYLKNSEDKKNLFDIAIPPDTSTQKVFYTKINPAPVNITIDDDGNWIAYFELAPKTNVLVSVEGYVQVFSNPIKFLTPFPSTLLSNLKPQEYWETEDSKIKELAMHLKTPENIHNFVTDNLTYNYDRVKPEILRLGAKQTLSETNNAICTEFTDLFIAISRAAGIPAREINGYAYSDNPKLQPLSLIADVLHSWPEYWNEDKQNWIPVDPTWESTSKIDYFNKFDLKHIAFVIHGKDSTKPLPAGSYKSGNLSKDVHIDFSTLPTNKKNILDIKSETISNLNPFVKKVRIKILNRGITAHYNLSPKIKLGNIEIESDDPIILPPFSTYQKDITLPLGLFAIYTPESIKVSVDNTEKEFFINKTSFVTQQLLIFLSILLFILILIGIKTKKFNVKKILLNINRLKINVKRN